MPAQFQQLLHEFDTKLIFLEYVKEIVCELPDDWISEILTNKGTYYIFETDYVEGFESVKATIQTILDAPVNFCPVLHRRNFKSSNPVKHAVIYQKPKDWDIISRYAADQYGSKPYNFIFLLQKLT